MFCLSRFKVGMRGTQPSINSAMCVAAAQALCQCRKCTDLESALRALLSQFWEEEEIDEAEGDHS